MYLAPKCLIHSFSSAFAVRKRDVVDRNATINRKPDASLKYIPHVKNSSEEYRGCLMNLNIPISTSSEAF